MRLMHKMSSMEASNATHNMQVEEQWSRMIGSESLLAAYIRASLLLLGNTLLFYMVSFEELRSQSAGWSNSYGVRGHLCDSAVSSYGFLLHSTPKSSG